MMLRTPQQVWENTCEDPRWITDQASILDEILREAFAAGYAEGASTVARAIEGHAARLGSQFAAPVTPSIPMGLRSLAQVAHELGRDQVAVAAAWRRSGAVAPAAVSPAKKGA